MLLTSCGTPLSRKFRPSDPASWGIRPFYYKLRAPIHKHAEGMNSPKWHSGGGENQAGLRSPDAAG